MKRVKKNIVLLAIISIISLVGCSSKDNSNKDNSQLYLELTMLIEGEASSNLKFIEDNVEIADDDIITGLGSKYIRHYKSDNAYYIQIDRCMYRFQFNNDMKIDSYVKYRVEA